jgi:hypothetical protein
MPPSTLSSVSRYRPAVLLLAGVAAAYATYIVYNISQSTPSDGLHRSNAVRRPNARQRRQASRLNSRLDGDAPAFGEFDLFGTHIPLSPHNLISPDELRDLINQERPEMTTQERNRAIEHVYEIFLDRLLALVTPNRPPSQVEADAITRWVADRHGDQALLDSASVARAVERHTALLQSAVIPAVDGAQSVAPTELSWGSDEDTEGEAIDTDGQTLQRTLYHIAEDRARQEGVVHRGITCNGCDEKPIRGIRWHCANCPDFDLCSNCEATNSHLKTHIFYKIRVPAPYLGIAKQEPLYPGRPHMMSSSVHSTLKKRLVSETKMEAEAIDALWDQFTCLAGTEWLADPNNIYWALDRRAFNHAFVPRYNSFVAAPNLIYDRIFAYYDSDKNGLIGFEEWIKGIDGMHTLNGHVKSKIVFNGYDVDGDGYISRKDILRVFRAYYAIEKEAARDYIAEITEELSVRNALDTIRSSQPLGSAFPPHGLAAHDRGNSRLREKHSDDFENREPVIRNDHLDVANREEILMATEFNITGPQNRAVTDRWARRQFYVDEEEGLNRPDGVEDYIAVEDNDCDDTGERAEGTEGASQYSNTRPRWSRSSSRVRFQDDVDMETRSNASTSSRPIGERWGGYEIPEPEKDVGKEVLYQITQQGFNELLDPLFEDRENDAMDAYAARGELRKHTARLEQINDFFRSQTRKHHRAICKVGIFRYSRCVVDMLCNAVNGASTCGSLWEVFHDADGTKVGREEARTRLLRIYAVLQDSLLSSISVPDEWMIDDMSLWNAWLCQNQLQDEVLAAVLDCASRLGWIPSTNLNQHIVDLGAPTESVYQDPTMPQFRPNTAADITTRAFTEDSATTAESSVYDANTFASYHIDDPIKSSSTGPFFVYASPTTENLNFGEESMAQEKIPTAAQLLSSSPLLSNDTTVLIDQAPTSMQGQQSEESSIVNWRDYTNVPMINILRIDSDSVNKQLRALPKMVIHSSDPYHPETDQLRPLYRSIRALAMDSRSTSYYVLLASLEAVQQEIQERKGSGLINLEEFAEHMQHGKLGFLGSWMEWVSI